MVKKNRTIKLNIEYMYNNKIDMININIEVLNKTCKTVSVRSLHKIIISNSKKISFNIFL